MTTYNPYAYQGYRIEKEERNNGKPEKVMKKKSISFNKLVLTSAVVIIFVMSFFIFNAAASTPKANIAMEDEVVTYVGSGDTLWSIAKNYYEDVSDVGYIVYLIMDRNNLESSTIHPGQTLILPSLS